MFRITHDRIVAQIDEHHDACRERYQKSEISMMDTVSRTLTEKDLEIEELKEVITGLHEKEVLDTKIMAGLTDTVKNLKGKCADKERIIKQIKGRRITE